ncbi:MAG TPA: hypothetical protein VMC09_06510 [Anaerolineales bacterium]|nr:hypothetical protein [Anaerolineales bacterium]
MRKGTVWSNITAYGLAHAVVDAACAATLFGVLKAGSVDASTAALFILVYDGIAFSTQPILGLLVDKYMQPARTAALGMLLVAAATLLMRWPLLAAVIAGIGNAIFHVGGGVVSLKLAPGKAALPGLFVAPGALGLTLGILIGKSGSFIAWPFIVVLLLFAVTILLLPRPDFPIPPALPQDARWFEAVIALLLASVTIRSLVGGSLVLPWKSDTTLLLALTGAVVLGKALGGFLADRFGWTAVAVSGLVLSAPLLAFFTPLPALVMIGTFLFNLSMPVTLAGVAGMLPGKSGFAFGLTTLALIVGALPGFTLLRTWTGAPVFIFASTLVSIAALYAGLRLYARTIRPREG